MQTVRLVERPRHDAVDVACVIGFAPHNICAYNEVQILVVALHVFGVVRAPVGAAAAAHSEISAQPPVIHLVGGHVSENHRISVSVEHKVILHSEAVVPMYHQYVARQHALALECRRKEAAPAAFADAVVARAAVGPACGGHYRQQLVAPHAGGDAAFF